MILTHEVLFLYLCTVFDVFHLRTSFSIDQSCSLALKKLWDYVLSIVAGTVFKWSVVITRFGKPSTSEIGRKYMHL